MVGNLPPFVLERQGEEIVQWSLVRAGFLEQRPLDRSLG